MATIKPFKGLVFNPEKVPIDKVVCPPYDVISNKERDSLYELHPYNSIRLVLNRDENPYKSAREHFERWVKEGVIIELADESMYIYEQEFEINSKRFKRRGLVCLLKLEKFGEGIFPHEKTMPKPKEDRLKLMLETNAQFDQIFGVVIDRSGDFAKWLDTCGGRTIFDFEFQGVKNKLMEIHAEESNLIKAKVSGSKLLIADGHHRYETAMAYRDIMRKKHPELEDPDFDYILAYITSSKADGLITLPTHRIVLSDVDVKSLVEKISSYFDVEICKDIDTLEKMPSGAFGLVESEKAYLVKIADFNKIDKLFPPDVPDALRKLDVEILHRIIFDKILGTKPELKFTHSLKEAIESIKSGAGKLAFVLNPVDIEQVVEVSLSGWTMPQKTTYFYPKLLSGIIMRRIKI